MNYLFRKLTASDVEARVQSCDKNGFVLLIYKNARTDQNILDETVGAENWANKFYECKGNLYCSLGINTNHFFEDKTDRWVWKDDCGSESNTEKEKGEASDARKRAGFAWGIGRELYTCPKIKVKGHIKEKDGKFYPEYSEFDVEELEVSDDRKITALKVTGKSMEGGYHEDTVFSFPDKGTNKAQSKPSQNPSTETQAPTEPLTMDIMAAGDRVIGFGKHKGKRFFEIETDYLEWVAEKGIDELDRKAAQIVIDDRAKADFEELQPLDAPEDLPF